MSAPQLDVAVPFVPLQRLAVERPWGGRRVGRRFGWGDAAAVGEWWLASAYPGAVTALAHAGSGDSSAAPTGLDAWLDAAAGARGLPAAADFPLLVKFLDAEQVLSVQVHPDDAVARRHGLPNGKTEAWHIVEAAPGAELFIGLAEGVTTARLFDAIEAGASSDAVTALLRRVPATAGDTWLIEAGTIHAVGPGVALFEVQQNSDATYRIHDWDRKPARALHLDAARDASRDVAPVQPRRAVPGADGWDTLVDGPCFRLARAAVDGALDLAPRGAFATLTVLHGQATVASGEHTATLAAGETALALDPVSVSGAGLDLIVTEPGA